MPHIIEKTAVPFFVLERLADHNARVGTLSKQFQVVLKPLVQLIPLLPLTESAQTHLFSITHIRYNYDSDTKTFTPGEIGPPPFFERIDFSCRLSRLLTWNLPDIKVNSFFIGLKSLDKENPDSVEIHWGFADYSLYFDRKIWERSKRKISREVLDEGRKILPERTLNFAEV